MANTIGTSTLSETFRIGYAQNKLALGLRTRMVAEKVCKVDRTGNKYLGNPYLTTTTATLAAIDGAYAVSTATTTDDTLTVSDQVTYAVHLFEFEETLSRADLFSSFVEDMMAAVGVKADQYVLNKILDDATGTYSTPAGGFTGANIQTIIAELTGKVSGYNRDNDGMFIVVENTDLPGFILAGMTSGFDFADATLMNGFRGNFGDVDVYVVRGGTFTTGTLGTLTATNLGKRLFGIKNVATYAAPKGIQYDEKKVTLKTGRELSCWANIGAKCWAPYTSLLVKVTIV